jgi:hypothetical protein
MSRQNRTETTTADTYSHAECDSHTDGHGYVDTNANTYSDSETQPNAANRSDAATASVTCFFIWRR